MVLLSPWTVNGSLLSFDVWLLVKTIDDNVLSLHVLLPRTINSSMLSLHVLLLPWKNK